MSKTVSADLLDLVHFLRLSRESVGVITSVISDCMARSLSLLIDASTNRIPPTIKDALKRDLSPQRTMPISHVEAIIAALDHQGASFCRRLDLHAFIVVYLILSRSDDCVAQQRGLALLTVRLSLGSSDDLTGNRSLCEASPRLLYQTQH